MKHSFIPVGLAIIITVIDKLGYEASLQGSTPNQKED